MHSKGGKRRKNVAPYEYVQCAQRDIARLYVMHLNSSRGTIRFGKKFPVAGNFKDGLGVQFSQN